MRRTTSQTRLPGSGIQRLHLPVQVYSKHCPCWLCFWSFDDFWLKWRWRLRLTLAGVIDPRRLPFFDPFLNLYSSDRCHCCCSFLSGELDCDSACLDPVTVTSVELPVLGNPSVARLALCLGLTWLCFFGLLAIVHLRIGLRLCLLPPWSFWTWGCWPPRRVAAACCSPATALPRGIDPGGSVPRVGHG